MSTLESIRNRAPLLVSIIIGMALLAFILGDFLSTGRSLFSRNQFEIAEIAGKSISYEEFQNRVNNLAEVNKVSTGQMTLDEASLDQVRNMAWQQMVEEYVLSKEYKELGIDVSGEELFDMIQGDNPHPIIRQNFSDPETGLLNRAFLLEFLKELQRGNERLKNERVFWLYLEDEIQRQRKKEKYENLIKKAIIATDIEAKNRIEETRKTVDFNYISSFYSQVADSLVTVTEKDLKEYYKNNIHNYKQKESRIIKYITFDVVPSEADFKAAENWVASLKEDFANSRNVTSFIKLNSDVPYDDRNWKNGELPETLNDSMFAADTGYIIGPYFENNSYRLAKLVKIDYLPDSVKARHILLPVNQNNFTQMMSLSDSLMDLLKNGADFAQLARENSTDGTAQEGGDLGWFSEGQMVKPFNDSCFYGKTGDIKKVLSQFGIHILEILAQARDVKKIKVGVIIHEVEPSDETDQLYYSQISEFAGKHSTNEKFNQGVKESVRKATERTVTPMDKTLPGLENPRLLIKWAFEASEKDISKIFKFGNKYTLATLEKVKHEGYTPLEDIEAEIKLQALKDKKAEKLVEQFASVSTNASSLDEIARTLNTTVSSASRISFQSRSLGNAGYEPLVTAWACNLPPNNISPPIEGNNGVFLIEVIQVNNIPITEETNLNMDKNYIERNFASRANISTFETLKEMAEIEDSRIKFY